MLLTVWHCLFAVTVSRLVSVHCVVQVALFVDDNTDTMAVREAIQLKVNKLNDTFQDAIIKVDVFAADSTEAGAIKQYFAASNPNKPHLIIAVGKYHGSLMLAHLCTAAKTLFLTASGGSGQFLYEHNKFETFFTPAVGLSASMSLVKKVMDEYGWTRAFIISANDDYYQAQANHLLAHLDSYYDSKTDKEHRVRNYLYLFNEAEDNENLTRDSVEILLERAQHYSTRK